MKFPRIWVLCNRSRSSVALKKRLYLFYTNDLNPIKSEKLSTTLLRPTNEAYLRTSTTVDTIFSVVNSVFFPLVYASNSIQNSIVQLQ